VNTTARSDGKSLRLYSSITLPELLCWHQYAIAMQVYVFLVWLSL